MDRGGRFPEPMNRRLPPEGSRAFASPNRFTLFVRRVLVRLSQKKSLRFAELALLAAVFGGTAFYGVSAGGHMPAVKAWFAEIGDRAANLAGFDIVEADVRGHNRLRRDEILAAAGITKFTSLVLLDADRARDKLKSNPWIAEAIIRKLYPNRVEIEVTEREAFALWQNDGKFSIVSNDGTVLEEIASAREEKLPLVVGNGANKRAAELLAMLERFPSLGKQLYGAVLVAERRWNLRLANGMDIRLPEENSEAALATLVKLEAEQKIFSRDISVVDLRIPGQVIVRMSDAAATAYDALRKPARRKGAS
jgi:cell division protein FtsQ